MSVRKGLPSFLATFLTQCACAALTLRRLSAVPAYLGGRRQSREFRGPAFSLPVNQPRPSLAHACTSALDQEVSEWLQELRLRCGRLCQKWAGSKGRREKARQEWLNGKLNFGTAQMPCCTITETRNVRPECDHWNLIFDFRNVLQDYSFLHVC